MRMQHDLFKLYEIHVKLKLRFTCRIPSRPDLYAREVANVVNVLTL